MDRRVLWQALNSMCGLALAAFLIVHIVGISTILFSPEMFNRYAETLEKSFVAKTLVWFMFAVLAYHIVYGITVASEIYAEPRKAAAYMLAVKNRLNGFWIAQVASGSALALFAGIHIWLNFFAAETFITADAVSQKLQNTAYLLFYFFFVVLLALHIVLGIRLILGKYGIGSGVQRKFCVFVLSLFIGALVLLAFGNVWAFIVWGVGV